MNEVSTLSASDIALPLPARGTAMRSFRGIAVFPGVVIAEALVLDHRGLGIVHRHVSPEMVPHEIERLDECLNQLAAELLDDAAVVKERLGEQVAMIFEAHARMVGDPHLRDRIAETIATELVGVEQAVKTVLSEYEAFFRTLSNAHFAQRGADFGDIERRILDRLFGGLPNPLELLSEESIVIAFDLTPSETAAFDTRYVRGVATEKGGRTSHTAIIAAALEIPSVVGLGSFITHVQSGDTVIVDGNTGAVVVRPDAATLVQYRSSQRRQRARRLELDDLRDVPAMTKDGFRIRLMANIEFPNEAEHCIERGADGIGLYRTEFLYLSQLDPPTEEEHYAAYARVLKTMGPDRPVTFRTLDLGADKVYPGQSRTEDNPFLGLRSIRLSLRDLPLFKAQLRAILRASPLGKAKIMFPLISTVLELRRCRLILNDVMEDLREEKIAFDPDIRVGAMIEVPSAALMARQLTEHVDFFSIGTNDLIQYTLACDRTNEQVAAIYNPSDPAVLMLVRRVVAAALKTDTEVNVCGEMSGDQLYTMLLLGMGLRQLSVSPHSIPELKRVIRRVELTECRKAAARVLKMDTAHGVTNFLRNQLRAIAPELTDDA